jgi:transcription elongation factor GreB
MSRGFVKESDQEELPFIPPRAPLPAGEVNYVTPAGLRALEAEAAGLEAEKDALSTDNEDERRRFITIIDAKLAPLRQRLNSARVINPEGQPADEVRFGATVTLTFLATGKEKTLQLVGVDEADVKKGKIAFTSPIAQAITGLWTNEVANFGPGKEVRRIRVDTIAYLIDA